MGVQQFGVKKYIKVWRIIGFLFFFSRRYKFDIGIGDWQQ